MTADVAVGFDFDHTLGVDNGLEAAAFVRLAADAGRPLDPHDGVWAEFIDANLARFRAGAITLDAAVEAFFARLDVTAPPAATERYRECCYALVDELVAPIDGASAVIADLDARGIPHAILTNGWSPLQQRKIARALDYRGPILVSDELGILKPDAAAFGRLIDVLGVDAARVWFVGDNPKTDILGAQRAGLRSVWFDWENMTYPVDAPRPDRRIEHLRDLVDVLRGPRVDAENAQR